MKKLLVKTVFCLFVFASCKSAIGNEEPKSSFLDGVSDTDLVTPYADMNVLENTRSATISDPDVVNWKVARFFAVVQKNSFEATYTNWKGATVSSNPILLYYPDSEKIKFYEFRVIKDGVEIGSITCNASKKEGAPVVYVSEMAHKVKGSMAKELISSMPTAKLIVANYPNQYIAQDINVSSRSVAGNNEVFKNALTLESIKSGDIFIEKRADEMLEATSAEELIQLGITEEGKNAILSEMKEQDAQYTMMWEDIDDIEDRIITLTDEEIEKTFHQEHNKNTINPSWVRTREEWTDSGIARQFILPGFERTRGWDSVDTRGWWCGPGALALITLGLGEDSWYKDVPLTRDKAKIEALYDTFLKEIGPRAKVFPQLNIGLSSLTNYQIWQIAGHRWQRAEDHLRSKWLPLISLRYGSRKHGGDLHYRVVIGTQVDWVTVHYIRTWWWFGERTKRWTKSWNNYWYCMRDHGVDFSVAGDGCQIKNGKNNENGQSYDFWEIAGRSYHCQLARVEQKK
ncbi:MAG: hypothetical protein ACTTIZ_02195 [Treponema sp.]